MTREWHRIFTAMPWGREVTSGDMFTLTDLPRGWTVYDVAQALRRLTERGDVERKAKADGLAVFTRKTRLIGDPT